MPRTIIGIIILLAAGFFSPTLLAADEDSRPAQFLRTFSGQVADKDWVASRLTVNGMNEMTFTLSSDIKVMNGTDEISITDLDLDDYVEVKYRESDSGEPVAMRITVQKSYPSF
jgi:hypothetical protein